MDIPSLMSTSKEYLTDIIFYVDNLN